MNFYITKRYMSYNFSWNWYHFTCERFGNHSSLYQHWDETGRFPNLDKLLLDFELPVCFLLNSSSKTCVRWYWPLSRFMVVPVPLMDLNGLLYPTFLSVLFSAYDFALVPFDNTGHIQTSKWYFGSVSWKVLTHVLSTILMNLFNNKKVQLNVYFFF